VLARLVPGNPKPSRARCFIQRAGEGGRRGNLFLLIVNPTARVMGSVCNTGNGMVLCWPWSLSEKSRVRRMLAPSDIGDVRVMVLDSCVLEEPIIVLGL